MFEMLQHQELSLSHSRMAEEDNVEERAGRKGGPKKLFKWNEEIRLETILPLKCLKKSDVK